MRDITIRGATIKRECIVLGICLALTFLMNIIGVVVFKTPWSELITAWFTFDGFKAGLACMAVFYAIITLFRLCRMGVGRFCCKSSDRIK